jgi:16S rRNA (guanine(1405)-N(7))-methyltransferase
MFKSKDVTRTSMPTREDIVHDILAKKELHGIEHAFVASVLEKELRRQPKIAARLDTLSMRSADYKKLVKAVRAVLRRNIGLFEGDTRHQESLLAELRQCANSAQRRELIEHLLATHASTRERLPFYSMVYDRIFAITGRPEIVLDIGCGLNPISFPSRDVMYVGVDVDRAACAVVQEYFSIAGIEGECRVLDAKGIMQIEKLPRADLALVFKLLELLEKREGHKLSERLLKALPAHWVVVSFPTMTSSGKPMRSPRRTWMELMLARLGYAYKTFTIPNEIFYIIRK